MVAGFGPVAETQLVTWSCKLSTSGVSQSMRGKNQRGARELEFRAAPQVTFPLSEGRGKIKLIIYRTYRRKQGSCADVEAQHLLLRAVVVVVSSYLRLYVLDTQVKRGAELSTDQVAGRLPDRPGKPKQVLR